MTSLQVISEAAARQGWSVETQLDLLATFIDNLEFLRDDATRHREDGAETLRRWLRTQIEWEEQA